MDSKYAACKLKKIYLNKLKMKLVPLGYEQSYGIIKLWISLLWVRKIWISS